MDCQDQRKRAFSQAFQVPNQSILAGHHTQPAKRILSYPLSCIGSCSQKCDQENEIPLDLDCTSATDETPGTQIRRTAHLDLRYANPACDNYASLQYELYGNRLGLGMQAVRKNVPPPILRHQRLSDLSQPESPLLTPPFVRGQSMFGPSPYIRPDISSPLSNYGDFCLQNEAGTAYYGGSDSPMSDATTVVDPLTPSALNFGDLSLNSQGYSVSSSPLRTGAYNHRATVTVVPTSSFTACYPETAPNEVLIVFDKGKEIRKVDKYPLCAASRFFAQLLDGPFLDHGRTRLIRLRDDFPYAIIIMLHFISTSHYVFDQRAFERFPLLTTLDFHIHAYLVSSKYGITSLQNCAVEAYLGIAEHELKMGFLMLSSDCGTQVQIAAPGFPTVAPLEGYSNDGDVITPLDRVLNSIVLLWKHTPSRYDALRAAVLELVKRDLSKLLGVPFFVTLLREMDVFRDDVVASLCEDGFEVQAFQSGVVGRQNSIFTSASEAGTSR